MAEYTLKQTPAFEKCVKRLHANQKHDLFNAVRLICMDPFIGVVKQGDLQGAYVYKFKMVNQLTLLAYRVNDVSITLLLLGSHQNFYRDLKRQ